MDFKELLEKYQALLTENNNLKEEINSLKAQLGIAESQVISDEISAHKSEPEMYVLNKLGEIPLPQ